MNVLIAEARRMAPSLSKGVAVAYFLRLKSGALYIGYSTDIEQRLDDHWHGQACRTTQLDQPASLLRVEACATLSEAVAREAQLKRWSRAKKQARLHGDVAGLKSLSRSRD